MKISGNTILITGGASGIGLEFATQFLGLKNTVIVTGRDLSKLNALKKKFPKIHIYKSDVSDPAQIKSLYQKVTKDFPALNILINNAGVMRVIDLNAKSGSQDLGREIEINLLGTVRMVEQFLPHLKTKKTAAILNVSSGLAFLPLPNAPIYCATKAAVHSYSLSLRVQLEKTNVKVFELAPPATKTPLIDGLATDSFNRNSRGVMEVDKMVTIAIKGVEGNQYEVCPGQSNLLRIMSRVAPSFMLKQLSKSVS